MIICICFRVCFEKLVSIVLYLMIDAINTAPCYRKDSERHSSILKQHPTIAVEETGQRQPWLMINTKVHLLS